MRALPEANGVGALRPAYRPIYVRRVSPARCRAWWRRSSTIRKRVVQFLYLLDVARIGERFNYAVPNVDVGPTVVLGTLIAKRVIKTPHLMEERLRRISRRKE